MGRAWAEKCWSLDTVQCGQLRVYQSVRRVVPGARHKQVQTEEGISDLTDCWGGTPDTARNGKKRDAVHDRERIRGERRQY